jgi:hypothetical protein
LVRGEREGTWMRVVKIKICGADVDGEHVADVARRWREYDVWEVGGAWKMERVTLVYDVA